MRHFCVIIFKHKSNNLNQEFTADQIRQSHAKVKSGADFPSYIKDLRQLGVMFYETYVSDGHTDYFGEDNFKTTSPAKYDAVMVSKECHKEQFKKDLLAHQRGKTSYPAFCSDCAKSGIAKWAVSLSAMTCTYFDSAGNEVVVEEIPAAD